MQSCQTMLDIESKIVDILKKAQVSDRSQILCFSDSDIASWCGCSNQEVSQIKQQIASELMPQKPLSALQILKDASLGPWRLSTSCPVIDSTLKGGILSGVITEVSGESASGKTQLCLQLCMSVQLNHAHSGGAVYICTEDVFPDRRLQQLIRFFAEKRKGHRFGDNIFIEHVADFEVLDQCIEQRLPAVLARNMAKLVVVDSVAALFRCHYSSAQVMERARHLSRLACSLQRMASQYNIVMVCVNQVSANMDNNTSTGGNSSLTPALGLTWANQLACRIMMSRSVAAPTRQTCAVVNLPTYRQLSVTFAPHLAPSDLPVYINDSGLHGFVT